MRTPARSASLFRLTSVFVALTAAGLTMKAAAVNRQASRAALPTEKIDEAIRAEQQRQKMPGVSVAIALDGDVRYAKGFGLADLENRVPVTVDSRFRTASIAKPLTATAVMQLVEQGRIDLDQPVQQYCPALPSKPWPVTPRQLLGHLGGVRHYVRRGESAGTEHFFTLTDSLRLFKNDPLLHQPGTAYEYSTYGYSVLGCAIEGASKLPYSSYMRANVFERAGMTHTGVDDVFLILANRVRGYQFLTEEGYRSLPPEVQAIARPNEVYNASLHDTSMKLPGGGLVSTPTDLARFGLAMLEATLVRPATVDQMWTSQKTAGGKETGYGFGFGVQVRNQQLSVSHAGNQSGAAGLMRISPSRRAVLVIMTNLEDVDLGPMANAIASTVLPPRP